MHWLNCTYHTQAHTLAFDQSVSTDRGQVVGLGIRLPPPLTNRARLTRPLRTVVPLGVLSPLPTKKEEADGLYSHFFHRPSPWPAVGLQKPFRFSAWSSAANGAWSCLSPAPSEFTVPSKSHLLSYFRKWKPQPWRKMMEPRPHRQGNNPSRGSHH